MGAYNKTGNARAVVVDFREPFLPNVFKGRRGSHGEADQKDIGLGVRQWAQSIIILLTGSIEQSQGIRFISDPKVEKPRQLRGMSKGRYGGRM